MRSSSNQQFIRKYLDFVLNDLLKQPVCLLVNKYCYKNIDINKESFNLSFFLPFFFASLINLSMSEADNSLGVAELSNSRARVDSFSL